jgi:hypothetical protein
MNSHLFQKVLFFPYLHQHCVENEIEVTPQSIGPLRITPHICNGLNTNWRKRKELTFIEALVCVRGRN